MCTFFIGEEVLCTHHRMTTLPMLAKQNNNKKMVELLKSRGCVLYDTL